jgi:hypothetical protein
MKLKLNQTPRKNIASLFLCNKIFQKQKKTEGKAILLPASCDAGKNDMILNFKIISYCGWKKMISKISDLQNFDVMI